MPILTDKWIELNFVSGLFGESIVTRLKYYNDGSDSTIPAATLAANMSTAIVAAWKPVVVDNYQFFRCDWKYIDENSVITSGQQLLSDTGNHTGESLPAFVTISLRKTPDNSQIEPAGSNQFTPGRIALSGIPEPSQNDGLIASTALTALNTLCVALEGYNDGTGYWRLFMQRRVDNGDGTFHGEYAPVANVYPARVGTQNTRKS